MRSCSPWRHRSSTIRAASPGRRRSPRRRRGSHVGGALRVPADQLHSAAVAPTAAAVDACLTLKGGDRLFVRCPSKEAAWDLVDALHAGVPHRAHVQSAASFLPLTRAWKAAVFLAIGLLVLLASWMFATKEMAVLLVWLPAMAAATSSAIPSRVTVGTDAVVVRWLGIERVIPLRDIARVEAGELRVKLHLRGGATFVIGLRAWGRGTLATARIRAAKAATLAERIRRAMGVVGHAEGARLLDLRRAGRPLPEWREALQQLTAGAGGFRVAATEPERLFRVVEDPRAAAEERAAAAVALRPRLDDEGRSRLRHAADACAAPRLRVAIHAAASAEDDAVDQALAGVAEGRTAR